MNMFWRVACFNIHESVLSSKSVYTTVRVSFTNFRGILELSAQSNIRSKHYYYYPSCESN